MDLSEMNLWRDQPRKNTDLCGKQRYLGPPTNPTKPSAFIRVGNDLQSPRETGCPQRRHRNHTREALPGRAGDEQSERAGYNQV